jgi:hypothetical protein
MIRKPFRVLILSACVLVVPAVTDKPLSAGPIDPLLVVKENGMDIGVLAFVVVGDGTKDAALAGRFQVTLENPATKMPYTLTDLAKKLGEDHFNWLQDYTVNADLSVSSLADPNDPSGKIVTRKYKKGDTIIDPQSGGQAFGDSKKGQWGDGKPWFYDESAIPKGLQDGKTVKSDGDIVWSADPMFQLSANAVDNKLAYFDRAAGQNIKLSFTTFLVSVGDADPKKPQNVYKPLAGFTWMETFDKDGNGSITIDTENKGANLKPARFTKAIDDEINSQGFGKWTPAKGSITPEPSTLMLLGFSLFAAVPIVLRWRRQTKQS